jgi:hypothetical protein
MKTLRITCGLLALSLSTTLPSLAAGSLLDLVSPEGGPDLFLAPLDVSYDAGSSAFEVAGWTSGYTVPDTAPDGMPVVGAFTLSAVINGAGVLTGGTLTALGDFGDGEQTLLTAALTPGASGTAFDVNSLGTQFSFLFTVTGGTLVNDFGGLNAAGAINLYPWFGRGDIPFSCWTSSFCNNHSGAGYGNGVSDCFPVPEPSTITLGLMGAALGAAARRCRRGAAPSVG